MDRADLVSQIKKKKELSGLSDSFVLSLVEEYLKKTRIDLSRILPSEKKIVVKEIRAKLRKFSGQYQKSLKRAPLDRPALLRTHSSTAERLDFYPKLKKIIATLKPHSILDLGCGLNPIALADKSVEYFASDIKEDELNLIKDYFLKNKIRGETFVYDLRSLNSTLPSADLCILFKVLDVVDPASKKRGKLTKEILLTIPCRTILVSFATRKLSGKKMNFPDRYWFEEILKALKYSYTKFKSENEIFYLITKSGPDK